MRENIKGKTQTHPVDNFPHHPVPASVPVSGPIGAVPDQAQLVTEAQQPRYLAHQVDAEAFKAVVAAQSGCRLFQHHVRSVLRSGCLRDTNVNTTLFPECYNAPR